MAKTLLPAAALMLLTAFPALADDHGDDARKFTAERVFDLEYGDDPRISPDGDTIVYVRRSMDRQTDRVRGDLWQIVVDSGEHRPLVTGGASAVAPRWSPDGERLLYTTSTDGKPELRLLYMDTGDSISLAQFPSAPGNATWSPDGETIAFTMFVKADAPNFATPPKPPEGAEWSAPVRVFDDITFRFDGRGYLDEGATHVFTLLADGGSPRQVTSGEADFGDPAWLGDDTLLVVGNPNEDRDLDLIESDIFAVDLETLERTRLTDRDGPDHSPLPSPDGDQVAYLGFDDEVVSWQSTRLYLMNTDGSDARE
ncbi:MAG: S9 family peptidase, partial [Pseudomonadota bacterium]